MKRRGPYCIESRPVRRREEEHHERHGQERDTRLEGGVAGELDQEERQEGRQPVSAP